MIKNIEVTYMPGEYEKTYDDSGYSVGNAEISDRVTKILVRWVSGSVKLSRHDGDKIIVREDYADDPHNSLRWITEGNTLTVRYRKSTKSLLWMVDFHGYPKKNLEVLIPRNLSPDSVKISSVSAYVNAADFEGNTLDLSTVSGDIHVNDIIVSNLKVSTVSGEISGGSIGANSHAAVNTVSANISLSGHFPEAAVGTIAGQVRVSCETTPKSLKISTVAGGIELSLPEGAEFTAKLSSVSGKLSCHIPCQYDGGTAVHGSGAAKLNFSTVSGGVLIKHND